MASPIRAVTVPKVAAIPPGDIPAPEWLAVSSEVSRMASRTFDVRAFGATGDGVTDDTDAIEAAIAAIPGNPSYGGAELVFPHGTYVISRPIVINKHGVHVRSYGGFTAILKPTAAVTTNVLHFAIPASSVRGPQVSNLRFLMTSSPATAIRMEGAYDNVMLANVFISGLNGSAAGIHISGPTGASVAISQTVIALNCWVSSGTDGYTGDLWRMDNVQEATFLGCKGVGHVSQLGVAYRLNDCRSMAFYNCSAAWVARGWSIHAVTRQVRNITIDQPFFEELGNPVRTFGASPNICNAVTMSRPRAQLVSGPIILDMATLCDLEVANLDVIENATCVQTVIRTRDRARVTMNGTNPTLLEASNSNNGGYTVGPALEVANGETVYFRALAPTSGGTAAVLLVNDGAVTSLRRVTVGAPDSAGTGFRTLRVPN